MVEKIKFFWDVLKETFREWNSSPAAKDSASLAYYAILSIPGLLIIIIWIAGFFLGEEAIRGEISRQIGGIMGTDVAKSIEDMIANSLVDKEGIFMKTVGVISLIFGATTMFFQLQKSLNDLWDVEAAPQKALVKFLLDRANSLGMILILGLLLMMTMAVSSLISYSGTMLTRYFGFDTYLLAEISNFVIGFLLVMTLFAMMFKVLPDAEIRWKSVWAGALMTAILFILGRFLLTLYFSNFKPTSAFGAAGTAILIMMWINYTCMLIFFGAEFTKVYTIKKGYRIVPSKHAKWTVKKQYHDSVKANS